MAGQRCRLGRHQASGGLVGFGVLSKGKLRGFAWAWRCQAPRVLAAELGRPPQ